MSEAVEITRLKTLLAARAKTMLALRDHLMMIRDHIEDEGDRVYFGSTNHAETFKEAAEELDGWAWHDSMEEAKGRDFYAELRQLRAQMAAGEVKARDGAFEAAACEADRAAAVHAQMGLEVPDSGDPTEAAIRKHNSRMGVELSKLMAKSIRALKSDAATEAA